MKNYAEIYVILREEIMQAIDTEVERILDKYEVESLSDLEKAPEFKVYVTEWVEDGWSFVEVFITDIICGDGECCGYAAYDLEQTSQPYALREMETDSLIEVYESLAKM
jgi:hypothetical protein